MRLACLGLSLATLVALGHTASAGGIKIDDVTGRLAQQGKEVTEIYEVNGAIGQMVVIRCRKLGTIACEVARVGAGGTIVERAVVGNVKPDKKDKAGKDLVTAWKKDAAQVIGDGATLRKAGAVPSSIKVLRPDGDKLRSVRVIFKNGEDVTRRLTAPGRDHQLGNFFGAVLADNTLVIIADWVLPPAPAPAAEAAKQPTAGEAAPAAETKPAVDKVAAPEPKKDDKKDEKKVAPPAPAGPPPELPPLAILKLRVPS